MENAVFEKYGRGKKVKYLVASLDDLKDVVDTVRNMITRGCDEADTAVLENQITLDALPLKNNLSSFILDLLMPENLLRMNRANRQLPTNGGKR